MKATSAKDTVRDLTVVAIYDGDTREYKELLLVMTQEQELLENWGSGDSLDLSDIKYVLGERVFNKKTGIAQYSLVMKHG